MVRAIRLLLALWTLLAVCPVPSWADEAGDELRIEYVGAADPQTGAVTFRAFEVGEAEGTTIVLEAPYDAYAPTLNADSDAVLAEAAQALEDQIVAEARAPVAEAVTDEQGLAVFTALPEAVYLISGAVDPASDDAPRPQPFFAVPHGVAHPKTVALTAAPEPDEAPPGTVEVTPEPDVSAPDAAGPSEGGVYAKTEDVLAAIAASIGLAGLLGALVLAFGDRVRARWDALSNRNHFRGWKQ